VVQKQGNNLEKDIFINGGKRLVTILVLMGLACMEEHGTAQKPH